MRCFITRHGQPSFAGLGPVQDHRYPPADPPLTTLGRRQATCLGQELLCHGFCGPIFSSPYRRTLETAQLIAEIVDTCIVPAPAFQEIVRCQGQPKFAALHPAEMAARYPRVIQTAATPWPWLGKGPEDNAAIERRVRPLLDHVIATCPRDALLVGHGATVFVAINLLLDEASQLKVQDRGQNWNCALTSITIDQHGRAKPEYFRTAAHLPPGCVTSNLDTPETLGIKVARPAPHA